MARRILSCRAAARGALWTGLALMALFLGLVALYVVVDPVSTLMLARTVTGRPVDRIATSLNDIAPAALAAIVASEDATFCTNDGIDWGALHEVLASAGEQGPLAAPER